MEELTQLQKIVSIIIDFCVRYSFQIVGALIILGLGIYIAGWISKFVVRLCEKKGLDVTLTIFMARIVKLIILTFVIIMALGKFGISVAPLIAALGAMAFGVSFALQGPLSNCGAGLVIIMTRPFVVGNTISMEGVHGVVEEVTLATTILSTEDGERITIPNKQIVGEVLINSFENKVVETSIGISYEGDPETAIAIVREILSSFPKIPTDPSPQIGIEEYADSSINIGMRYWVPTKAYYETLYAVNLSIYKKFKDAGITIPYPQRDIHIVSDVNQTA
ncbi:MAG: mechanosensitive ion channel [Desulfobacteraceae bacterium]|nr:mechanosensitive ion channel [Desulfobacteraceae bacterium]MBC2758006.1 mechanosensitive ion channel [Desulfobacteraceae bacterium]